MQVEYTSGASPLLSQHYCEALSKNFDDTKLELLRLEGNSVRIDLHGDVGEASGIDTTVVAKIRKNVQRQTCPPLFAAFGSADTDSKRKQCLVEALEAIDILVVFDYITANQNNLIALIQRMGRTRKRQRED